MQWTFIPFWAIALTIVILYNSRSLWAKLRPKATKIGIDPDGKRFKEELDSMNRLGLTTYDIRKNENYSHIINAIEGSQHVA